MLAKHFEGVIALQALCFPRPFPADELWTLDNLQSHQRFPQGQMVICVSDQVVASASAIIISEGHWNAGGSWEATLGGFDLLNHDTNGSTLFAADISVHPDYRGLGLGRQLYEARFELVQKLGLARLGTACRLPGYCAFQGSVSEYATFVAAGKLQDRTMTPLLKFGLRFMRVLEDFMDDEESGNSAAQLEWKPTTKRYSQL